ncbi:MAG: SufD family Fe-S cluster assembly protein [Pseudomonadota bacterium]|nr:SufD family Fe-S cluster assembly protein [Pseudomonadota bacterium]MEC7830646.1 SufD family Fe-S cluster assembly protein [Pseudomonadota bacterium]MEC9382614.1 SufD family Fe-S cluster assembly protein [Pseudomonadota bacterium]MEC9481370.1 SufD family Fe-S cluster assembly protein [Pseudomonadota bacterium]
MNNLSYNNLEKNMKKNDFLNSQRLDKYKKFLDLGLPNKRTETWKYFDLKSNARNLLAKEVRDSDILIEDLDINKNKYYDLESENTSPEIFFKLNKFIKNESVIDMNLACASQLKVLDIKSNQKKPISVTIKCENEHIYLPRIQINLADGVKAKILLKNFSSNGFTNLLIEYSLGTGSFLELSRLNQSESLLVESNIIYLKENSNFNLVNLSLPKGLSRFQAFSNHIGKNSFCSSNTISIPQHNSCDDILVDNVLKKSNCESNSGIRAIVDNKSTCSFQSLIDVEDSVTGSKAEQDCKAFLLSKDSVMNALPKMKIYNDNVVCKHGATVGSLDKQEIFYLCSRGLTEKKAISLLLEGHISSYIDKDSILRKYLPGDFR